MRQEPERQPAQAPPSALPLDALGLAASFELVEQELHAESELVIPAHHLPPYVIRSDSD